jgi:KaiC/GvpD/RAD55 family RecA-like ATPase
MKKTTILLSLLIFFGTFQLRAGEGMWLPLLLERLNYADMQKMGLQLTPEELYSINHSSLKDAIVGLSNSPNPQGYFCTAEIVSGQGLIFTNHHCGYASVQKHSTVEHDYLKDGFWAFSKDEELPNEGLTASVLVYMSDVTDSIVPVLDTVDEHERISVERKIISKLAKEASEGGRYNVVIKPFFEGNEYYMFVYLVYRDVRLVGAPPSSIGKFGGDTDNWMWPRHTGDFTIFRIYTAPDGSPAEYSEENIPLKPKHYLPISLDGIKKDDFAMIWGFPGSTSRYLTAEGVKFRTDKYFPPLIESFGKKLEIWKKHMDADQAVKIKYAANYAGIANSWKYFIGQKRGVEKLHIYDEKKAFEKRFTEWVNADEMRKEKYGNVLQEIENTYAQRSNIIEPLIYASITGISGAEIIGFAQNFSGIEGMMEAAAKEKKKEKRAKKEEKIKKQIEKLKSKLDEIYKDYDENTDRDVLAAMTEMYMEKTPDSLHPEYLKKLIKKFKGNYQYLSGYVFSNSVFANKQKFEAFLDKPSLKKIKKDPAFNLMKEYMTKITDASSAYRGDNGFSKARRLYIQAIREMQPEKVFYPDANSTLRFSYGKVEPYNPADAVEYDYQTHLYGVMEKEDPASDEFTVPAKLKELYEKRDFGPYGQNGKMDVDFLTTNDITGGNSGSPVINGKGELIGLAFDGNWEAMSSDIAFNKKLQRTIVVDIRYVLFVIDKYAGASNIVDELTIHKSMPQPSHIEKVEQN